MKIQNVASVSLKDEALGGVTTFLSMMYIIVVNPMILSQAGVPFAGALMATVLVAFLGCVMMGLFSNNPIAVAPGMGINAFFTYTVVQQMHVSWQVALGVVFWSGIIFTIIINYKYQGIDYQSNTTTNKTCCSWRYRFSYCCIST